MQNPARYQLLEWSWTWGVIIMAVFVSLSASQESTCQMPSVEVGQKTTLTCDLGVNLQADGDKGPIKIEHKRSSGRRTELIFCSWEQNYTCEVKNSRFRLDQSASPYVTLHLLSAQKEDEGSYICRKAGLPEKRESCNFTIAALSHVPTPPTTEDDRETPKPTTTQSPIVNPGDVCAEGCVPGGWLAAAIVSWVLLAAVLIVFLIIKRKMLAAWFRTKCLDPSTSPESQEGPAEKVPLRQAQVPAEGVPSQQSEGPAEKVPLQQSEGPAEKVPLQQSEGPAEKVPSQQSEVPAEEV